MLAVKSSGKNRTTIFKIVRIVVNLATKKRNYLKMAGSKKMCWLLACLACGSVATGTADEAGACTSQAFDSGLNISAGGLRVEAGGITADSGGLRVNAGGLHVNDG